MTSDEFETSLKLIGWDHAEFSKQSGLPHPTVSSYAMGESKIPSWVENYLHMMIEIKKGPCNPVKTD